MIQETFVNHRNFRWLWLTLIAVSALSIAYLLFRPVGGHSGGSIYGLITGGISLLGIIFLMWYGRRKRNYTASHSTLKGSLSAHIWVGISLAFIVPLHAGFHFGFNIHTLAYVIMMVTIVSGIWGALNYGRLAASVPSHRGAGSVVELSQRCSELSKEIEQLCRGKSDGFMQLANKVDFEFNPTYWQILLRPTRHAVDRASAAALLARTQDNEREEGLKLINLVNKKCILAKQIQDEVRVFFLIRSWLYLHLPISFALMVAVALHIFVVSFIW